MPAAPALACSRRGVLRSRREGQGRMRAADRVWGGRGTQPQRAGVYTLGGESDAAAYVNAPMYFCTMPSALSLMCALCGRVTLSLRPVCVACRALGPAAARVGPLKVKVKVKVINPSR